jgi:murein L,D-transpeptidase YcbB/YkuD
VDRTSILDTNAIISLERASPGTLLHELWERQPDIRAYTELRSALRDLCKDTCDEVRARMIHLNMERWRWKRNKYDRYVWVNIPSFLMRVVEDESLWLETRVIVGKQETPTPVMESIITSFIIYPYWHAPRSISTREILPQLQADASYLKRNNFDVLDRKGRVVLPDTIQWNRYSSDYFPFILRQREGSENSMGIIKFVFANKYGVYLHDTNSKRLFSQAKRDLSHGCIRVSNAVAFAHYLVKEDDIYVSPEDLDQYLSLQQRLTIQLRKPIPVLLDYFTVEVLDGRAVFYDDIYKKDSVLMQRLYPTDSALSVSPLPPI